MKRGLPALGRSAPRTYLYCEQKKVESMGHKMWTLQNGLRDFSSHSRMLEISVTYATF